MILTLLKIYPTIPTRDCQCRHITHLVTERGRNYNRQQWVRRHWSLETDWYDSLRSPPLAAPPSSHLSGGGRIFFFKCFVCKFNEECFTGSPLRGLAGNFKQPLDSTSLSFELVRPDLRRRNDVLS